MRPESDKDRLLGNIMAGLPGAYDRYDVPGLRRMLDRYADIDHAGLRAHLARFLREVIPAAEEAASACASIPTIRRAPLFGLPRIVSTAEDLDFIVGRGGQRGQRRHAMHRLAGRAARATTCRPWPSTSPAASISRICATLRRNRTGPSWRPITSVATSTWSR